MHAINRNILKIYSKIGVKLSKIINYIACNMYWFLANISIKFIKLNSRAIVQNHSKDKMHLSNQMHNFRRLYTSDIMKATQKKNEQSCQLSSSTDPEANEES